jgi:hypothetical protein|nr:MAG TPA: hypothetical protein [Caudoviricetes sp.]
MKQILQIIIYIALAILACAYIGYLLGFTAAIAYQAFKFFS